LGLLTRWGGFPNNHSFPSTQGHDAKAKRSKPWGEAIGAAVIVNIVTLAGIALMVPVVAQVCRHRHLFRPPY
jgi:hypothetical protein